MRKWKLSVIIVSGVLMFLLALSYNSIVSQRNNIMRFYNDSGIKSILIEQCKISKMFIGLSEAEESIADKITMLCNQLEQSGLSEEQTQLFMQLNDVVYEAFYYGLTNKTSTLSIEILKSTYAEFDFQREVIIHNSYQDYARNYNQKIAAFPFCLYGLAKLPVFE